MTQGSGLRLLHVINQVTPGSGSEVSLGQMAPVLSRRGVQQGLVTLRPSSARELGRLEAAGVRHYDAGGAGLRTSVTGVLRAVRDFRPDVLASSLFEADLAARVVGARTGTPVVCSVVGMPYDDRAMAVAPAPWKLRLVAALEGVMFRRMTTHVHAVTEAVARDVRERHRLPESRITVVPRGRSRDVLGEPAEDRRAKTRHELGISSEDVVVLNVGRQDPPKAHALLVSAFAHLAAFDPRARLLIAGREGAATRQLHAAVRASPAHERITLLGMRDDVPDLLCAADLFAFSSLWEGIGGSVLEAMAMEVPVVAFDVPAIVEVLGGCGTLVPAGDTDALGRALCALAADPQRRQSHAEQARRRFEEHYALSEVVGRMQDMYERVASAGRSRVGP